tara:strand:- start:402 stop:512 length:111 start_codon:yes stop_codon:yes gene_type:complete
MQNYESGTISFCPNCGFMLGVFLPGIECPECGEIII